MYRNFNKLHYKNYSFKLIDESADDLKDFSDIDLKSIALDRKDDCVRNEKGILIKKGEELGKFNLGSTIVMLFEADENFEFTVAAGEKVKYGQVIGKHIKNNQTNS